MTDDNSKKPGLKLQNNKSMFAAAKKPSQQELDAKAREDHARSRSYKERASELAIAFRKMLEDATVPENKNPFILDLEKENLGKLIQLAVDMNHDEQEEEGMGSVGVIALLLRCLLIQRDKINLLDYSVAKLEKTIAKLEANPVDKKPASE